MVQLLAAIVKNVKIDPNAVVDVLWSVRRLAAASLFLLTTQGRKNDMKTRVAMVSFLLIMCGFAAVSYASETLGTVKWRMTNMEDSEGDEVSPALDYISVAVDRGGAYFNVYGALLNGDGSRNAPVSGAGYIVDYRDRPSEITMELRANLFYYKLTFDIATFDGSVDIYRADGVRMASGRLRFVGFVPAY